MKADPVGSRHKNGNDTIFRNTEYSTRVPKYRYIKTMLQKLLTKPDLCFVIQILCSKNKTLKIDVLLTFFA
jgi:hypothetical protein